MAMRGLFAAESDVGSGAGVPAAAWEDLASGTGMMSPPGPAAGAPAAASRQGGACRKGVRRPKGKAQGVSSREL